MNPDLVLIESVLSGSTTLPVAVDCSPISRALGMAIDMINPQDGTAISSFRPAEIFLQGAGVLQGGAVAAMLDYAMIASVMVVMPKGGAPATTNLNVSYLRPAPLGSYLAKTRVLRKTRSVIFAEATLVAENGDDVAHATATTAIKLLNPVPNAGP